MATFTKFQPFVENLAKGKFDFSTDVTAGITVALSATAPTNTWGQLSQVTQIAYTNLSSRACTITSTAQSGGTYTLKLQDLVLTASGTVATFRYVILYGDVSTNDLLIGSFDYGQDVTLQNGDTFTLNFDETNGVLQLA